MLAALTDDDTVTRNLLRTARPFTLEKARFLIERAQGEGPPVWGIDDGRLVGVIGLRGEFGFWLGGNARGQGYGYEAGRAAITYAFDVLGLDRLIARPILDNAPSRHLLNKLGFVPVGREQAWCQGRAQEVTLEVMRLDAPEGKGLTPRPRPLPPGCAS